MPREGVVFVARRPGWFCGWHEPGQWQWTPPEGDDDPDGDGVTRIRLVLSPGSVVEGRVTTLDGQPIERETGTGGVRDHRRR